MKLKREVLEEFTTFFSGTGKTFNIRELRFCQGQGANRAIWASGGITTHHRPVLRFSEDLPEGPSSGEPKRSRGRTTTDSIMRGFSLLAFPTGFLIFFFLPISCLFLRGDGPSIRSMMMTPPALKRWPESALLWTPASSSNQKSRHEGSAQKKKNHKKKESRCVD